MIRKVVIVVLTLAAVAMTAAWLISVTWLFRLGGMEPGIMVEVVQGKVWWYWGWEGGFLPTSLPTDFECRRIGSSVQTDFGLVWPRYGHLGRHGPFMLVPTWCLVFGFAPDLLPVRE